MFQVAAAGKPILYTVKAADAHLAASAPILYKTVLSFLEFFEADDQGGYRFVGNTGLKEPVPRHLRGTIPDSFSALAKARGRRWW